MDEFITIHLEDIYQWVSEKRAQQVLLRYLHDRGIEGDIGVDDKGTYIRYYRPDKDVFDGFSLDLYEFITNGGK